ncbi:MAG: flagellar basal body protein, partial [Rhodothermales bacterium]
MIRSLRTGVSGLQSNQVRMDVVGNNIANVNTLAYKRGRAAFNEL